MKNIDEFFEIATLGEKTITTVNVVFENKSAILRSKEELINLICDMEDRLYIGIKDWVIFVDVLFLELKTTPNEVQFTDPKLLESFFKSMKYDKKDDVEDFLGVFRALIENLFDDYDKMEGK